MAGESSTSTSDQFTTITPSDVTVLEGVRGLFIKTGGNLNLGDITGNTEIFAVTAGQVLPVQPTRVMSTSTTATVIGLY